MQKNKNKPKKKTATICIKTLLGRTRGNACHAFNVCSIFSQSFATSPFRASGFLLHAVLRDAHPLLLPKVMLNHFAAAGRGRGSGKKERKKERKSAKGHIDIFGATSCTLLLLDKRRGRGSWSRQQQSRSAFWKKEGMQSTQLSNMRANEC